MPKITAWIDKDSEKIFNNKTDYINFLKEKATKIILKRRSIKLINFFLQDLYAVSTINELCEWILKNGALLEESDSLKTFIETGVFNQNIFYITKLTHREPQFIKKSRHLIYKNNKYKLKYEYACDFAINIEYKGTFNTKIFSDTNIFIVNYERNETEAIVNVRLFESDWKELFVFERLSK